MSARADTRGDLFSVAVSMLDTYWDSEVPELLERPTGCPHCGGAYVRAVESDPFSAECVNGCPWSAWSLR